jgi:hypothetical protein
MKTWVTGVIPFLLMSYNSIAQCSICTKTAQQMGKESAEGLNSGIVYLMLLPFAIAGFIAWKWWKNEKSMEKNSLN